jgi:protease YdgD
LRIEYETTSKIDRSFVVDGFWGDRAGVDGEIGWDGGGTRAYPWSAIGRIEATKTDGSSYTCTGTLIGTDIVLTNAHCLMDATTNQPIIGRDQAPDSPVQIVFQASMIKGVALDSARVIDYRYGTNKPQKFLGDDWAILKLDKPLGSMYGYLG